MSRKIKYIIRSGDGFLVDPISGEMVGNVQHPAEIAGVAKKYDTFAEANKECTAMHKKGLQAEVVELCIGEIESSSRAKFIEDPAVLIVEALHEAGLITTMDCMQAMKVIQKELRKWSK